LDLAGAECVERVREKLKTSKTGTMSKSSNSKRSRSRSRGGGRRTSNRGGVVDSNGPDVRVRGTAQQVIDKYLALARDAMSSGDRILAENFYQHADHYYRVVNGNEPARSQRGHDGGGNGTEPPTGETDDTNTDEAVVERAAAASDESDDRDAESDSEALSA
jgi:hypothetical protein